MIISLPPSLPAEIVEVWHMTNEYRESMGLSPLNYNIELGEAADKKSDHMIEHDYIEHISPKDGATYKDFISATDYNSKTVGENLACGFKDSKHVFQAWLKSPSHRANIEDARWDDIGISAQWDTIESGRCAGKRGWVIVQEFGSSI